MRFRNSRLRTKIAALLVSLVALWVFAAWVTMREGLNLLAVNTLDQNVTRPAVTLVTELQQERRLSIVYLAGPTKRQRAALDEQRREVDTATAAYREGVADGVASWMAGDNLEKHIKDSLGRLDALEAGRKAIDTGSVDRTNAAVPFNDFIDVAFRIYGSAGTVDDAAIAKDSRTLNALSQAKELLAREDALLSGALAAGRFKAAEHAEFVQLVGTQRYLHEQAAAELSPADRTRYGAVVEGEQYARMRAIEDHIMQSRPGTALRIGPADWRASLDPVQEQLQQVVLDGGDELIERAKPMGYGIILRLALAGGLGLIAVIASIVVSITTARALVRQLERLRNAALELAEERLPGVVERLGHGEKVDVAAEAPPLKFGSDEIGQVGRAFNVVQETAIATAVEQAELRRGIRDVLLSLARRTQTLVHRQLTMLDTMERRRDIETKELEELFRLDHLATRMRRNAENLIVLSGALPARGWRNPVPMIDVVRAAVAEVEDYARVTVLPVGPIGLAGRAVGDVTHLLAELIENAVSFSPPDTVVQVGGHLVGSGFAIDIEDRGLGMTDEKLAEINRRIDDPPDFNLQSSVQLGLFVVSKLAERYGLRVSLKRSAYGGTTAVVVIPSELIVEQVDDRSLHTVSGEPAATTPNGLEVRQPAGVGAASTDGNGASGPALVAVPGSSSGRAAVERATESAPRTLSGDDGGSRGTRADEERSPADVPPPRPADTGERPVTIEPEDLPPVPEISTTPSGLPVRVPQENLAEPLRAEEPTTAPQPDAGDEPGRSPEDIRRIMGSYQRGTRQGRSDAAATDDSTPAEGEEEQ